MKQTGGLSPKQDRILGFVIWNGMISVGLSAMLFLCCFSVVPAQMKIAGAVVCDSKHTTHVVVGYRNQGMQMNKSSRSYELWCLDREGTGETASSWKAYTVLGAMWFSATVVGLGIYRAGEAIRKKFRKVEA